MVQQLYSIAVKKFKTNFDEIIEYVGSQHKNVIITKNKKPIVKLIPYENKPTSLFGALKGSVIIKSNIVGSSDEVWEGDES